MRINTNIAAMRACYHLTSSDEKLSSSIQKLSSGKKLVNIKDNPVGASMSVKMRTQIKNLDRATQNTNDGISVVQTAEGTLAEIEAMLQRINELSVQGASDTYSDDDRVAIVQEINEIRDEIDRVASDTDFNTQTLLDGTFGRKTYTNNTFSNVAYISETVTPGTYSIAYEDTAQKAELSLGTLTDGNIPKASFNVNGALINFAETDSLQDVYEKLMDAGKKTGLDITYSGSLTGSAVFTITQQIYGVNATVDVSASEESAAALGLAGTQVTERGQDATANLIIDGSDFKSSASYTVDGRDVTIKDYNGFEMTIKVDGDVPPTPSIITVGVTDVGPMTVQVGANEYQEMRIEIPEVSTETLGIDRINAHTSRGCGEAITLTNKAIAMISSIRTRLGAYQNRMEDTVSTLELTEENMTSSLSGIEDVDMADEMTKYTTYNVMTQAATSMLAQANQLGDKMLQLLQ